MFNIAIEETKIFLKVFETINKISSNININFNEKGMFIDSIDDSSVCYIFLECEKDFFKSYELDCNCTIGINVSSFLKILKCLNPSLLWELCYKNNVFEISTNDKSFSLTLLNIDTDSCEIPELEYDIEISLNTKEIIDCFKDLTIFDSEEFRISTENNNMIWESFSQEGNFKKKWKYENNDIVNMLNKLDLDSKPFIFSISYVSKFCKDILPEIKFCFSREFPLKMIYKEKSFSFTLYVAPRISDED